ncbi:MAG: proline--tRNA ligase, partial [Dehalococcoidia bacterium]
CIRGDLSVNEVKLRNALKCKDLRLATEEEMTQWNLVPGYVSPVGVAFKPFVTITIVIDDSVRAAPNLVAGANKPGYHVKNVNYPRDFPRERIEGPLDIALAEAGHRCPKCSGELLSTRGIEVGHIFKLGTVFSQRQGAFYLDRDGNQKPLVMGCYGIGIGRLLAAAIEQNHDEKGVIWPVPIAPYHIYLCALGMDDPEVVLAAEKLYAELEEKGFEVLFDDRIESAGVKFNDADLLGVPVRVVVSQRTLKSNSAELKLRREKETELVSMGEVSSKLESLLE